jgi:hypothetical protein
MNRTDLVSLFFRFQKTEVSKPAKAATTRQADKIQDFQI